MPVAGTPARAAAARSSQAIDLGLRLRELRQLHKLSQRELARRSGLTNGTISLIEQNKISPSVASLKKLLDCMSTSLPDFFSVDEDAGGQPFFSAEDMVDAKVGDIVYRHLGHNARGRQLEVMRAIYEPGADLGEVVQNRPDCEEVGLILRGRLEVTIAGQTRVLGPGDGYYVVGRQLQHMRNPWDETCEYLIVCTPPGF